MEKKTKASKKGSGLTRVLHPNRYFIWAIVVIIIGLGGLAMYIQISSINESNNQIYATLASHQIYYNQKLGFSVDYPASWVIDSSSQNSVVTFDNPTNPNDSISVSSSTLASVAQFKKASKITSENSTMVHGLKITVYTTSSPEDAMPVRVAVVETPKKAYYISGTSNVFDKFVNSFKAL